MRTSDHLTEGRRLGLGRFLALGTAAPLVLLFLTAAVRAQSYPQTAPNYPQTAPNQPGGVGEPDQPVQPRIPTLVPRAAPQPEQPPRPPFTLTPQEEAQVDEALNRWEQRNREIKTFDCRFERWIYDVVFGPPNQAKFVEIGTIKYASPDRGLFWIESSEKDGKEVPIDSARAEHWMCDGKSIWEYCPAEKKVKEHKIPPELQGKAIANTPLPFLFGEEAQKLKQRYFIRLVTPPNVQDKIYLEAYPRFQRDAANFYCAVFVIKAPELLPFALQIIQPNGKDYTNYKFSEVVVNNRFNVFKVDPFRPSTPWGWQMIPDRSPTTAAKGRGQS